MVLLCRSRGLGHMKRIGGQGARTVADDRRRRRDPTPGDEEKAVEWTNPSGSCLEKEDPGAGFSKLLPPPPEGGP